MKRIERITYASPDLVPIFVDLYLPEDKDNAPLLLYFHGGGLEGGSRSENSSSFELLAERGIAVATADYRMYPKASFPKFIEDAANAVVWAYKGCGGYFNTDRIFIGGASAGAYIAMMLCFDTSYLSSLGVKRDRIAGFIFDAGQTTVHFNVLRERGEDTRLVRVDKASPLYFIENPKDGNTETHYLFIIADHDIPARLEQIKLMISTMQHFGYPKDSIHFRLMEGYGHCAYHGVKINGKDIYSEMLLEFIQNK